MEFNRVRKPPGGDTNDIFRLEERQRCQRGDYLVKKGSENETGNSNASSHSKNVESFAPIDLIRVRKPPGGDTHDIFGMESRQKSDALKLRLQQQICEEKEDTSSKNSTPEVTEQVSSLPPLRDEINKENRTLLDQDTDVRVKLLEEMEEDTDPPSMKYYRHNTITGEVREMSVPMRLKLKDCSNVSEPEEKAPVQRSNIRVRQPPGGTSNIFF